MARARLSKPPSPYPRIPFHLIRLTQLLSSIIVASILSYFIHHLSIELYSIPWTFILVCVPRTLVNLVLSLIVSTKLITVSLLTIVSYMITAVFYHQRTLRPNTSSLINGALTLIWILAFTLMVWNISGTLRHKCDIANWSHEIGIMVCRLYKALAAFTVTGLYVILSFLSIALQFALLIELAYANQAFHCVLLLTRPTNEPAGYVSRYL